MQGPAIRAAREKGYRTIVVDADPSAIHAADADEFHPVDLKDAEGLLALARTFPDLAGVLTAGTDFSASVAFVSEALGLPGISRETALNASDKARMRTVLAAAGVPIPRFAYGGAADDPLELGGAGLGGGYPLVVKPVDNMGARGCRLARDPSELAEAWSDAMANSRCGRVIIEEYLDGPEFSIDALVSGGTVSLRGVADRHVAFSPFFVELGHTMPSAYGQDVLDAVVSVFLDGVRALGIRDGAAKGDIKYTARGAFVGEIAARLSGGFMSGWTYPYSSGVDPVAEAIDIACGRQHVPAVPSHSMVSAERAYLSIPGRVAQVRGLGTAKRQPFVKDVFPRAGVGDRVVFPSNNVQKCGNVISQAPDRASAERAAESAARSVLLRLAPDDPQTEGFLRGRMDLRGPDGAVWPPPAYEGVSAMCLALIESMPDCLRDRRPTGTVSYAPVMGMDREDGRDWSGRGIREALDAVRELTGATEGLDGDLVLGRPFWKALLKGGYQGAAWVVDTELGKRRGP